MAPGFLKKSGIRPCALGIGLASVAAISSIAPAPAQAGFTSSILFSAAERGILGPMDFGPLSDPTFSSSSTLACPIGICSVSQSGSLFSGATTYGTAPISYTAGQGTGTISQFTKPFTGVFTPGNTFTILGGVNPITVTLLSNPFSGGVVSTTAVNRNDGTGFTQNYIDQISNPIAARVQVGNNVYSTATVAFNGFVQFEWGAQTNDIASSNLWVYVDENSLVGSAVPSPLPILGASAAFGWTRKLRRRIRKVA